MHAMTLVRLMFVCALMAFPAAALGAGGGQQHTALLVVAGTDMSRYVGGSGFGNVWSTMTVQSSFSVSAVRDVYFYTYWKRLSGEHLITLWLYSPDGHLYQRFVVPISIGGRSSATRQVEGVENPVDVQRTAKAGRYHVAVVQLPVAGTWITEHRLLGAWRVDVLLDDESTPAVSGSFTLTE
jgi:hypothetical protein